MNRGRPIPQNILSLLLVLSLCFSLAGCGDTAATSQVAESLVSETTVADVTISEETEPQASDAVETDDAAPVESSTEVNASDSAAVDPETVAVVSDAATSSVPASADADETDTSTEFDLASVPAYSGSPYAVINNNVPFFTEDDYTTESFETYSELDELGRCGVAYANIGVDLMPTEDRGSISSVKPSGWQSVTYDNVDGGYLYNRCHLIGYQLTAENANELNLITGTRYMNVDGMLPFENMVADYVEETEYHVLYRVTPIFEGDNLVASGVLMEAWSVEDEGDGICFCVYCYNVQPGITINYEDGTSSEGNETTVPDASEAVTSSEDSTETTYILNTNTHKFHYPSCSSVSKMSEANKEEYTGTRENVIAMGYEPCGNCNP